MDKHTHDDSFVQPDTTPTSYSVAFWLANRSTLDAGPNFNILDTADNISGSFNKLDSDDHITQIIISDDAAIVLNVTKLSADTDALSKLINADNSAATVTIKDTAAHIGTGFATIGASDQVTSIVVSDNAAVTLTGSQVINNGAAIDELINANASAAHVTVKDTAVNIVATLYAMFPHQATITSIVVSNSAQLVLTGGEVASFTTLLGEVVNNNGNPVTFAVVDTGAQIGAWLDAIQANAKISTITDSDNSAINLNIAQFTSDAGALAKVHNANSSPVSFIVTDSAANIGGGEFDSLNNTSSVTKIIVNDSASHEVTITALQAVFDTQALNELFQSNGSTPAHVEVSDTAANISNALNALNGNTHVDKIVVSDSNPLNLGALQVVSDATVLGKISGSYTISVTDTAADITANLDALQGNSHVTAIVVSDNAEITVSIAQLSSDAGVIGDITNSDSSAVHVIVSDTAADILSAIVSLNGNTLVNKIIVSDSATHEVTLSVAQAAANGTVLGELFLADGSTAAHVAVQDTAANIGASFDTLNGNSHVDKIIVFSSGSQEVQITVAQLSSDTVALGELFKSDGVTAAQVAIFDTAALISSAFDTLNSNTHVNKIVVSDSSGHEVTITAAQAASDTVALGELYQSDGSILTHVAVSDTAADISSAFDALNGNSHVNKIIVSDSGSNEVTINAAQAAADTVALGELVQSNGSGVAHVAVLDTAAHISSAFDALNGNSHVDSIYVSGGGEVTITALQAANDTNALSELFIAGGSTPANVAVNDTAANISSAFDALNGNGHVDKIVVNDSGANEVTISVASATSDTTALAELVLADGTTPAHVAVQDEASIISSAFDTLNGNSHVDKIIVSDSGSQEVQISVAQLSADTTALGELFKSDGTTAAQVAILDLATNISTAFDTLNGSTSINKIIVSDGNEVSITVAQATNDTTALNELFLTGGTTAAHVAVTDTAENISNAFDALNSNTHVDTIYVSGGDEVTINAFQAANDATALNELFIAGGSLPAHVAVSDTAAHISAAFDALNGNSHVDTIIVSDSGSNEVTITAAQAASDTTALSELFLAGGTVAAHVAVNDSAANISSAFDALNGNSHVDKIVVSDSATDEVKITAAQAADDTTALNELRTAGGVQAQVAVFDLAANISGAFDALESNGFVNKVIVSDSANCEVSLTALQAVSDQLVLNELVQADGSTPANVAVSDSAAAISTFFDTLSSNSQVDKITINDSNPLMLFAGQVADDTAGFAKISGNYTIDVTDNAANITANLDALESNGHVALITVNDNAEITVAVDQLTSDFDVINDLVNANTQPVHIIVSDTAANIVAGLDTLDGFSVVNKIIVSDSATNEVTVSTTQLADDALGKLVLADGTTPAHIAVQDTASAITAALDTLSGNSQVNKIIVSNSASDEVTVSVSQLTSDATALSELVNADGSSPAHVAVIDTAAAITTALDALNNNTQVNKIIVNNTRASSEVRVTVAQLTSDAHALAELFNSDGVTHAKVAVVDTASAISGDLNALNSDSQVDHIIISDSGAINVTATQALSDATALSELQNANGNPVTLIVTDTAGTISADLDQLNADAIISSVVISDNLALTLSATQITSDASILAKISNANASGVTIHVVDSAANISLNLDALKANNDIVSITVSDNAPITVNVAQITSDAVVLSELVNANASPISLTVLDTVANIRGNLAALNQNTEITSIVISNNAALRLTIAQFNADTRALSILHNANGSPYQLQISDTAAHISASLNALAGNSHITIITDTDSAAIVLSIAQITSDAAALALIHNANSSPYALNVTDTAANISTAFDALSGNSHVIKIVVSDSQTNEVLITAVQFAADGAALADLVKADGVTQAHVNVADSAANISLALNGLGSGQVDKITVTDSGSHEVVATVVQISADAATLAKLFDSDGTTLANVAVSDVAVNISAALDSLATNTQVNKILVFDSGSSEVTVSVAQLSGDATALAELYTFDGSAHASITVKDTASDITSALSTLQSDTQVNKIIVSDSGSAEVGVSVAQLTTFAAVLGELFDNGGTIPANVVVSDTGANIAGDLDALNGNTQVNKIIITDTGSQNFVLTVAQITTDTHALSELFDASGTNPASITVTDTAADISAGFNALAATSHIIRVNVSDSGTHEVTITAAQAQADGVLLSELFQANSSALAHVEVSDTAADISSAIGFLNSHSQIDHIVISDGDALGLTVAQLVNDTTALGKIVGSYAVNVTDTAVHIKASLDALNVNPNVTLVTVTDNRDVTVSIAQLTTDANILSVMVDANGESAALRISDTAANIQANLGNLEADEFNHNIDFIVISDNGPITLSASQLFIDTDALLSLRNADGSTVSLTISDTAANIQESLDSIRGYNSVTHTNQVTTIIVTNNAAITVSAEQVHDDASILAEIQNRNGSTVSFRVVDTAADISTYLDSLQANSHISSITVSDNAALNVTLAQLTSDSTALSKLRDADGSPYKLNVSGTAANLSAALHTLGLNSHVHELIVTDSGAGHEVSFNVAQLTNDASFFGEIFNSDGTTLASLKLTDSATHLQALSVAQLAGLAAEGFNTIDSSTNKLLLDLSHYEALGTVHLTSADVVTVSDTASGFAALSTSDIAALSSNGVDRVVMSGSADFSVAQWNAFGSIAVTNNGTIEINGTSGQDTITVGKGNFVLSGLGGGDAMTVGAGHDTFVYGASSESTGTNFDTIHGFNALTDSFQLTTTVTGIDHAVTSGMLDSGANFDSELMADLNGHLNADHAILFTATSGSLSGHTFLIVETNGAAGYQNGDLVIDVTGGIHLTGLSLTDFTQPT